MKILFISSWFPNKLEPTNGNFVQRHAEAVALLNDVEVLHVIGDNNQEEEFIFDDKILNGIRTLIIYYKNSNNPALNILKRMKAYKSGFSKMKRPDVVHANVLHNNMLFAVYLKKKYKIPFVVTEHWTALQAENLSKTPFSIKKIAKYIAGNASYVLPVSYNLKESLELLQFKTPMKVISNVVDTDVFTIAPKAEDSENIKFVHVSSLISRKRPQEIIKTVARLREKDYPVSLEIGGDGDTDSLIRLVRELKADSYVHVFGALRYEQVAEKMQRSDYFILFSDNETQGCVILESYACGKPVISTMVGGTTELILDGLGIGVRKNNTEELYNVLEDVCRQKYAFKNKEEIRRFAVDGYSRESIARKFTEIYQEIVS